MSIFEKLPRDTLIFTPNQLNQLHKTVKNSSNLYPLQRYFVNDKPHYVKAKKYWGKFQH